MQVESASCTRGEKACTKHNAPCAKKDGTYHPATGGTTRGGVFGKTFVTKTLRRKMRDGILAEDQKPRLCLRLHQYQQERENHHGAQVPPILCSLLPSRRSGLLKSVFMAYLLERAVSVPKFQMKLLYGIQTEVTDRRLSMHSNVYASCCGASTRLIWSVRPTTVAARCKVASWTLSFFVAQ